MVESKSKSPPSFYPFSSFSHCLSQLLDIWVCRLFQSGHWDWCRWILDWHGWTLKRWHKFYLASSFLVYYLPTTCSFAFSLAMTHFSKLSNRSCLPLVPILHPILIQLSFRIPPVSWVKETTHWIHLTPLTTPRDPFQVKQHLCVFFLWKIDITNPETNYGI